MIEIPSGDYYDCMDRSELRCESAEEAIEEYIDAWIAKGESVADRIRRESPISVNVYRRKPITDQWIASAAASAIDGMCDMFEDEFSQCGESSLGPTTEHVKVITPKMIDFVRELFKDSVPYDCELVATVKLEAEQVEAMMREHWPDWFEVLG